MGWMIVAAAVVVAVLAANARVVYADREISWELEAQQAKWKSELRNTEPSSCPPGDDDCEGPEGSVKFLVDASGELKIEYEFETETGVLETETQIRFRPQELIEFVDTDGNGKLSSGEWRYNTTLKDDGWRDLMCVAPAVGATIKKYTCDAVHTTLDLTFRFTLTNVPIALNITGTTPVNPAVMKVDMLLHNFPYRVSGPSRLALVTRATAKTTQEPRDDDSGSGTEEEVVAFGKVGVFAWVKKASNGNASVPIFSSPVVLKDNVGDEGEYDITFSFGADKPSHLVWDPQLGASSNPMAGITTSAAGTSVPTPSAAAAVAAAAVVALCMATLA